MPNLGARPISVTLVESTQNGVAGAKKYKKNMFFNPTLAPFTLCDSILEAVLGAKTKVLGNISHIGKTNSRAKKQQIYTTSPRRKLAILRHSDWKRSVANVG